MTNEKKCIYCDSFSIFKELRLMGASEEDAFHTVMTNFEDEVINEAFQDGYVQAMLEVNNLVKTSVEKALL